jgi:hypothetical protein
VGSVVDPSLSWQGYLDDGAQPQPVTLRAYFDCDGSKGIHALLLDESATWCADCQSEAQRIAPEVTSTWKSQGVEVVTLMAEDQSENPATLSTALSWRNEYALTSGAVCADPRWTTKRWGGAPPSGNGFPTNVVIDPRTMKIIALQPANLEGVLANLVTANGG